MTAPLFSRESVGGAVARKGFEYQDDYALLRLPEWLSLGAFHSVVSEVLGDVEVRYFRRGGGTCCVLHEAKKYELSKTEFWAEIARFVHLHRNAQSEYARFVLVCPGYARDLRPLVSMLETLRGRGSSLNASSTYRATAEDDVVNFVVGLGQDGATGRFVLERVYFETHALQPQATMAFGGRLLHHLPVFSELRGTQVGGIQSAFEALIARSAERPVLRVELEAAIADVLQADAAVWTSVPTEVRVLTAPNDVAEHYLVDTAELNGPMRGDLGAAIWNARLAVAIEVWESIKATRGRRTVRLDASHRMSAAAMLGFAFSATRGARLVITHRGESFDCGDYRRTPEAAFAFEQIRDGAADGHAVVAIAFAPGLLADIERASGGLGLAGSTAVLLSATRPIASNLDLTAAVEDAKRTLADYRSQRALRRLHLFVKGPSHFAMALGHRFNALGEIQLYDWVDTSYRPTALLRSA